MPSARCVRASLEHIEPASALPAYCKLLQVAPASSFGAAYRSPGGTPENLAARGVTGRYYFSDVPFLALWGRKYISISRPFGAFIADCAAGTLPQVSFLITESLISEHPPADIQMGQHHMSEVINALISSKLWTSSALFFTYDEGGGFFL